MSEPIHVFPLSGWETHTLPQRSGLLTLQLVPHQQAFETGERIVARVSMSAAQARELAEALLRMAEAAEMGQAPSAGRN